MSQQLQITGGAKVRDLQDVIIGTSGVLSSLAFNVANGVPKLDVNGKILVSQLPNSVMEYQGTWNAATNTPTLVNGTGNQGDVYLCNVAGTTNFGAGPITFAVGDSAIYSGTIWQRAGGATGTVTSVGLSSTGNDAITITGSPITTSGNINLGFAGTNLQYINGAGDLTTFPTLISSIGLTMPSAFSVANSPLTSNGTIAVTGAGYPSQYIRGDGTLADFPTSGGGGSSVSYYLNGGTSQGTIGGVTYYEMSKTADTGTGVDFTKSGDGFIVAFLTDAGDPAQLNIPAGNWNYEIYASMSANGGTPEMYAELYKYDGTTFTLISTSSNEILYDGTNLNLYTFAMTVPSTTLAITDRLAVKLYATNSGGKTTTVHTQDSHLCQIITTFSTGITALNGLTAQVQYFATGTSGTDFNISSTTATHTFNIPDASATNRGLITTGTQTIAGSKTFSSAITADSGITLKEGVIPSAVGYTGLAGDVDGLVITKRVSSTAYTNLLYFNSATSNTYTFPNASGTLAILESTQTFSGVNTFSAPNNFDNVIRLKQSLPTFSTSSGYTTLFSTQGGGAYGFGFYNGGGVVNFLDFSTTTGYTYTFPTASGTLALTSQLGSYLPLAGGIMTGSILLNNNLAISGQLFGTSSYASMLAMSPSDKVLIDNSGRGVIFGGTIGQGAYTYTLPSATGTLALTSNLSSYVPYTGATGAVNLGAYALTASAINVGNIVSDGNIILKKVGLSVSTPLYITQFAATTGVGIGYSDGTGGGNFVFPTAAIYNYTFPAATGTIALTSDLGSYVPLAGNVNITGPLGINTTGGAGTTGLTNFGTFITRSDSTQGFPRKLAISMASGTLVSIDASGNGANYITDMAFSTSTASGLNATPAIYITGTNNRVGIKTGTPAYDLDVSGTGRFTGALTGGGNITTSLSQATSTDLSVSNTSASNGAMAQISAINGGASQIDMVAFGSGSTGTLYGITKANLKVIRDNSLTAQSNGLAIGTDAAVPFYVFTNSVERMRITSGGNVNINGTGFSDVKFYVKGSDATSSNYAALFVNGSASNLFNIRNDGAVQVFGSLSKGSGSFRIDHPLESMTETHQLVHSFIEGPRVDLIYRGKLTLVNGKAQANIDEMATMTEGTFEALCREVQCFTTNESGWDLVKGKVIGNIIYIESQNVNSTDEISWMVIGERKDKHILDTDWTDDNGKVIVEPLKRIEPSKPTEPITN